MRDIGEVILGQRLPWQVPGSYYTYHTYWARLVGARLGRLYHHDRVSAAHREQLLERVPGMVSGRYGQYGRYGKYGQYGNYGSMVSR